MGLDQEPGLEALTGHCVVFLDKILYSRTASFQPGVYMGTGKLPRNPVDVQGW